VQRIDFLYEFGISPNDGLRKLEHVGDVTDKPILLSAEVSSSAGTRICNPAFSCHSQDVLVFQRGKKCDKRKWQPTCENSKHS
jgi:hypothetical protein